MLFKQEMFSGYVFVKKIELLAVRVFLCEELHMSINSMSSANDTAYNS